jgi:hypothetical protein
MNHTKLCILKPFGHGTFVGKIKYFLAYMIPAKETGLETPRICIKVILKSGGGISSGVKHIHSSTSVDWQLVWPVVF